MLHPQTRALLDLIEQRGVPPTHTLSPGDAREFYRERRFATQPPAEAVGKVQDLLAAGPHGPIPLRLYRPLGSSDAAIMPVLVYYHGGGFVIGDLDTHDTLCRELANLAGVAVVAVDYRMGPEHRFPAAVIDCIAATRWVRDHAAGLRLDASRYVSLYGMTELTTFLPECSSGRYHYPPWVIPLVLDKLGESLAEPENGELTGRLGFFDLSLEGHWGALVSGDHGTLRVEPCTCGRRSPSLRPDIVRFLSNVFIEQILWQHYTLSAA